MSPHTLGCLNALSPVDGLFGRFCLAGGSTSLEKVWSCIAFHFFFFAVHFLHFLLAVGDEISYIHEVGHEVRHSLSIHK